MSSEHGDRIGPPHPDLIETEIGDEVSIYDPRRERVVVLNESASDVWRLADGEHTLPEILTLLASSYQVEPETIRQDVETALRVLYDEQLLTGRGSGEADPEAGVKG